MKIIKSQPFNEGNYPSIQNWNQSFIPEGYYLWADGLSTDDFYKYNGFVILNITKNTVVGYELNEVAWNKWKGNNPQEEQGEDPVGIEESENTEILNILLGI